MANDLYRTQIDNRNLYDCINSALMVSGNADFFSVSSLTLTLECSATDPFVIDIGGKKYRYTSDITLAVTDDAHNFIFCDNASTMYRAATPPTFAFAAPGAPASGDYWYDLSISQMKNYNGSSWDNVSRVYIGYCRADSGSINARYVCDAIKLSPIERFHNCGDGSDGFLNATSGTTTIDGTKKYTAIVQTGSAIITHTTSGSSLLSPYVQTVVAIIGTSNGIDLNGKGRNGGNGGTGAGSAGSGPGHGGSGGGGGGGTSAGAAGASTEMTASLNSSGGGAAGSAGGGTGGNGSASNWTSHYRASGAMAFLYANGGGGGGGDGSAGANGGPGGGGINLIAPAIAVGSGCVIRANGTNGTNGPAANRGAGGGGGGGIINMCYRNYWNGGTVQATGGTGGTSGGAGSGAGGNGGAGVVATERV